MDIPIDMDWLQAVMLAGVRMAAFVFVAPPFSSRAFPANAKAILSVGLGLAVSPAVVKTMPELTDAAFFGALVMQALIGAALGFLVYLVYVAIEMAGGMVDLFGGFTMSAAYDPLMNLNGAQFTRLFQMAAFALMFTSGAYQLVLAGVAGTFTAIPIGAGLPAGLTAQTVAEHAGAAFGASFQIAGPLILVLFLSDIGMGLLTRVAPALNAFQLSFPLKVGLTLALGAVLFAALPALVQTLTGQATQVLTGVF